MRTSFWITAAKPVPISAPAGHSLSSAARSLCTVADTVTGTRSAMNRKILVTGFTGRLGSLVAETLRDRYQLSPRVLVRPARLDETWVSPPGMEVVAGDYTDPDSLTRALRNVESVFLVSPVHPDMVERELAVAAQAAAQPTPARIVKISGLGTRLDSPVASGHWHAQIEHGIRAVGLSATCLQPLFFMQNLAFQMKGIRRDGALRGAVEDASIAMVDARDIAAVAAAALLGNTAIEGQSVILTGGEAVNYDTVAEVFGRALGHPVRYERQTREAAEQALRQAGQPDWHVRLLLQFNEAFQRGEGAQVSDVVRRVLGREPRTLAAYVAELAGGAGVPGTDPFPS